jgi:hypothetical protein
MAPGVILSIPHLVPVDVGPERVDLASTSDEGPNMMTFNTCVLSARRVVNT